ncbi:hypothetical protein [Legionella nagasakiensis]|uniref:hypothetical protein n=1 Tax=Legionella nagasakiensis TaxID=535290 RepID=UPI0013EF610E|nr:hypothetical protein [Legionella nagasakiensis]
MKKYILYIIFTLIGLSVVFPVTAASTFSVETPAVIQNMVPNSSQNLVYTIKTTVPAPNAVNVHCEFTSNHPELTASFNNNGCVSSGGGWGSSRSTCHHSAYADNNGKSQGNSDWDGHVYPNQWPWQDHTAPGL